MLDILRHYISAAFGWIELHVSALVGLANIFLVFLTMVYVWLTRSMVREMRSTRDPSVVVDLEFPDMFGKVSIGNTGQSAALDVSFSVVDKIQWGAAAKGGLNSLSVFESGISYLAPNRHLKFGVGIPDFSGLTEDNKTVSIAIDYKNDTGRKFHREFVIDLSQYKDVLYESFRDPGSQVADAIKEAERSRKTDKSFPMFSPRFKQPKKECIECSEKIPENAKKCSHCAAKQPAKGAESAE